MAKNLLTLRLQSEHDVVLARQRAGQLAGLLGFGLQDQSRIATALSEIARNAYEYAQGGTIVFRLNGHPAVLEIEIQDKGSGIPDLDAVVSGDYRSPTGMGLGIIGARRLMDGFRIESSEQGTTVWLEKQLPPRVVVDQALLVRVAEGLTQVGPQGVLAEVQKHNQEMLRAMDELQKQQVQLLHLNQELEDTNRGVIALYAELDERAALLVKSNELKTRFLSNISHELRTPLNAIMSLSGLLMARSDGDLTPEQEKQVGFIRASAESLQELVNDLLDLAKVEAGKLTIRPEPFEIDTLFSTLRGMLRPLLSDSQKVNLIFVTEGPIPELCTDEGKVSQILRNFISNAIKFTAEGEVRVTARIVEDCRVQFCVADTGIGIAAQDMEFIFEEFTQVENAQRRGARGTGLGLPLARKLAQLLGGNVDVRSELGRGSVFCCTIPCHYQGSEEGELVTAPSTGTDMGTAPEPTPEPAQVGKILIIDNDLIHSYLLRNKLLWTKHEILEAPSGRAGLELARKERPVLIFLDLVMPEMGGFAVLETLRADNSLRDIPVIIHTSKTLTEVEEKQLRELSNGILSKEATDATAAAEQLRRLAENFLT